MLSPRRKPRGVQIVGFHLQAANVVDVVVHTCDPSPSEVEAGGSEAQGQT